MLNHTELNRPTYVAFIDFKTAFPNTCRPALWAQLYQAGITNKMWRNIQALYTNTKGRVLHPLIKETDTYNINIGLLEGSKLSPILYAFLVNSLLERLQQLFPHLSLSTVAPLQPYDTWTGAVLYADDLTLVARPARDAQHNTSMG